MTRLIPRYEIWDALVCQSGAPLSTGRILQPSQSTTQRSLQQIESVTVVAPRNTDAGGVIREGHILRKWWSDSDYEEWPVGPLTLTRGEDATVTAVARHLKYRLGECGWVTQPGVDPQNGLPILTYSITDTPTNLVTNYLTARSPSDDLADQLSFVSAGTIDPTAEVTLDVDWWSPQQFLDGIIAGLELANVFAEWDLVRNGTTDYQITIVNTPLAT